MDIDIDVEKNTIIEKLFPVIKASMAQNGELVKHPVGYYFQAIPIDILTNLAAIPYDKALDEGFFKIDFLNLSLLSKFKSKAQMKELAKKEPNWSLLQNPEIVQELFHLNNHFDIISIVSPTSIDDLADIFALIRPNKRKLLDKYIKDKENTRKLLYIKESSSDMRKSHAYSYALLIKLQLTLFSEENHGIDEKNL
jgi:hypothetical protein